MAHGHGPEHGHGDTHDPFDRRVAMTIAIIAAALAGVTTLSHRGHTDVLRLQSEANDFRTQESDQWNYYQAKNIRRHLYEEQLELASFVTKDPGAQEPMRKAQERWRKQFDDYKRELPEEMAKAKELHTKADEKIAESHVMHEKVDRYDGGELGIELGLVLCSVSVLTKQRGFWFTGILSAILGLLVVFSGMLNLFLSAGHH